MSGPRDAPSRYNGRMAYRIETHPNARSCLAAAVEHARLARENGLRPVLICDSCTRQLALRRSLARSGHGFGIEVTTLRSWAGDLWACYGDGSAIVDDDTRTLEILRLLVESELGYSQGTLKLLCDCAAEALPFASGTRRGSAGDGEDAGGDLSVREGMAVDVLLAYRQRLRLTGLTETCEALEALARAACDLRYRPIVYDVREDRLSAVERRFLNAVDAVLLIDGRSLPDEAPRESELVEVQRVLFRRTPGQDPVKPGGAVRCCLAAGPSASARSTAQALFQALDEGCRSVVVAGPDPCRSFDFAISGLQEAGVEAVLSARCTLAETDAGRAFVNLGALLLADKDDPLQARPDIAADFALNPLSGIPRNRAFRIAKSHRANRLVVQDDILTDLAGNADESCQGVIGLLERGCFADAVRLVRAYADRRYAGRPAYRLQQDRALSRMEGFFERARELEIDLPLALLAETLAGSSVSLEQRLPGEPGAENRSPGEDEPARVLFTTMRKAAALEAASVDCVILTDLEADSLPIAARRDSLSTLLGKLGAGTESNPLVDVRSSFYSSFEAARRRVCVQRSLNDDAGAPAQAASVFEELADCYRLDPRTAEGVDRATGIPESLAAFCIQTGEEDVLANAGAGPRKLDACASPLTGSVSEASKRLIVLPQSPASQPERMELSPSQIESYLECPYSWFAKRRLRLEGLDEGFSAMERGTFLHDVLRRFYLRFQSEIAPKVTDGTADDAQRIMEEVFAAACAEQPSRRFGDRYAPRTAWERKEQQGLLPQLIGYLSMEARLLPGFTPTLFEWQFPQGAPVAYAGCDLRGCVDRIDMDGQGRAVIFDYKSSLGNEYRLHSDASERDGSGDCRTDGREGFVPPHRIQALVYAKAVQDVLGCTVVGAFYLNPLQCRIVGAWDGRALGEGEIPFASRADADNSRLPYHGAQTMGDLIGFCEQSIAERLERLAAGDIAPAPIHEAACRYCPVNICAERLSERKA